MAADGRAYEGAVRLTAQAWEAAKVGDSIRVEYLPDDPRVNRAAGESGMAGALIGMLMGPLFVLIRENQ
jgi:hypothetical protein